MDKSSGWLYDVIGTKYIDECLLRAVSLTNTNLKKDYRQVQQFIVVICSLLAGTHEVANTPFLMHFPKYDVYFPTKWDFPKSFQPVVSH